MACVYRYIRLDKNEPFYIGASKNTSRPYVLKWRKNWLFNELVKKVPFEIEIMLDELEWDVAKEKEKEFISLYGRIDIGTGCLCNHTDGGDGVVNLNPIGREKIRESRMGSRNPMFGKRAVNSKKVYRYDFSMNYIGCYDTVTKAAEDLGVVVSCASMAISKKYLCKGFILSYQSPQNQLQ